MEEPYLPHIVQERGAWGGLLIYMGVGRGARISTEASFSPPPLPSPPLTSSIGRALTSHQETETGGGLGRAPYVEGERTRGKYQVRPLALSPLHTTPSHAQQSAWWMHYGMQWSCQSTVHIQSIITQPLHHHHKQVVPPWVRYIQYYQKSKSHYTPRVVYRHSL